MTYELNQMEDMESNIISILNLAVLTAKAKEKLCLFLSPLAEQAANIPIQHLHNIFINVDCVSLLKCGSEVSAVSSLIEREFNNQPCAHLMALYSKFQDSQPRPAYLLKLIGASIFSTFTEQDPKFIAFRTNNINALRLSRLFGPRIVPSEDGIISPTYRDSVRQYIGNYYSESYFDLDRSTFGKDYGTGYKRGASRPCPELDLLTSLVPNDGRSLMFVVHRFQPSELYKNKFGSPGVSFKVSSDDDLDSLLE